MKKTLLYAMLAVVAITMQSCLHDDNETFDQSAAERIDAAIEKAEAVLLSSEHGWVLHYYAGQQYAYGGLNLAMKFNNGKVTMYQQGAVDRNHNYQTYTSTYKFSRDQGPVLAFDTYNDFLHSWGDPMGANAPTDVDGWEADYEFVVMNISDDQNTILLKGKKFGNMMIMERLLESPEAYFDHADAVAEVMGNYETLSYKKEGKKAHFTNDANFQYIIKYVDDNGDISEMEVPFTYTNKGIIFNQPIELYEETISGIEVNLETAADGTVSATGFQLKDDPTQVLTEPNDPNEVFTNYEWYVAASNLGSVARPAFDKFVAGCTELKEVVQYMYLGPWTYQRRSYYGLVFRSGRYLGCAGMSVETDFVNWNQITFTFNDYLSNADYYVENASFGEAVAPYLSTFTIQFDDPDKPARATLTDVNNPANVITLVNSLIETPAEK